MPIQILSTSVEVNPTLEPNVFTPQTATARRGLAFRISPYLKINGSDVDDVSNIDYIYAKLAPLSNVLGVLVEKSTASIHVAGGGGTYDGAGCCDFDFTSAEMNLDLTGGDGTKKTFAVMFSALLDDGKTVPLGQLNLTVYEDPAVLSIAALGSNSQNARITTAGIFQVKNLTTGNYVPVWFEGSDAAPELKWGAAVP